jgi:hypothetical protein
MYSIELRNRWKLHARLSDDSHGSFLLIDFGSDRRGTVSAQVFIFIPFRNNQQQAFPDRNRLLTLGTVKLSRIKFREHCGTRMGSLSIYLSIWGYLEIFQIHTDTS